MGKTFSVLDGELRDWIGGQQMFFVATAPLGPGGRINVSPKGLDTFRILGPAALAYLDLTGSGVETISHLRENGRITIMFCAFEGAPRILRLYGKGTVHEAGTPEFHKLAPLFPSLPGTRSIIRVDLERIADSCGFAVPLYAFQGQRDTLIRYSEKAGELGLEKYRREKNRASIDGLPGLPSAAK